MARTGCCCPVALTSQLYTLFSLSLRAYIHTLFYSVLLLLLYILHHKRLCCCCLPPLLRLKNLLLILVFTSVFEEVQAGRVPARALHLRPPPRQKL